MPISEKSYNDLDDFIDEMESSGYWEDAKIDCYSHYVKLSLLSLIALFL